MMQEEYQLPGSGIEYHQLVCNRCQTPLPLEPNLIRRVKMSINGPLTSWEIRRCPTCGLSNAWAMEHSGGDSDE